MRRLDELLMAASDRGDRTGADVLIQRLERRLHGEREQVVAAPSRRTAMATTIERPVPTDSPPPPRRRWALALAAFAVAVAAVAIAVVTLGGSSGEEEVTGTAAIEKVEAFAVNIRNADLDALIAGAPPTNIDEPFVEWMIGLRAEPEFTDCRVTSESINGTALTCDVSYRAGSFFTELFGSGPFPFSAQVTPEGLVSVTGWPPPPGLSAVVGELRTFFEARHSDLVDTVFGTDYAGLAWSRTAGEAVDRYLSEFMEWRTNPAAEVTPDEIMARLALAIEAVDSQIDDPIVPSNADPLGQRFLAWNVGLGIDPAFSDCREMYSQEGNFTTFQCAVTMGDGYFFSAVAGENLPTSVTATVQMDGRLTVGEWPAPDGLVEIEQDFRRWIQAEHPELEDRMFGFDFAGVVRFTGEAGELHSQYLAEYLAYLAG